MFNKLKRAFSHSSSKRGPEEEDNDAEEDATKILDDKIKRTNTLKDTRKGRDKGPKNRRVPSQKRKPLFDRFLAKLNINKKEKKPQEEAPKVVTEEDAKASEVLDVVEKTEVLEKVERAPPPRNRRRPQRHNRGNDQADRVTKVKVQSKDDLDSGVDFLIGEEDGNEKTTEDNTKQRDDKKLAKRKILTPKTFSLDHLGTEADSKSKPPLPGKEKPSKGRRGSNASERKISEESTHTQLRTSISDEDASQLNLYNSVTLELCVKHATKEKSPSEDLGRELDMCSLESESNDGTIEKHNHTKVETVIEKPKLPSKKKPKQENKQIHVIVEESESFDDAGTFDQQVCTISDEDASNMGLHNALAAELEQKIAAKENPLVEDLTQEKSKENSHLQTISVDNKIEKPKLPSNKKPNRRDLNEKIIVEESEPSDDSEKANEQLSTILDDQDASNKNIYNALATELQIKLASKDKSNDKQLEKVSPGNLIQKPKLPLKKKPSSINNMEEPRGQGKQRIDTLQNETNTSQLLYSSYSEESDDEEVANHISNKETSIVTKEFVDHQSKKPKLPSKKKPTKLLTKHEEEDRKSLMGNKEEVEFTIEDKENANFDKKAEERDSKIKSKTQAKPLLPNKRKPPKEKKEIILEDLNQNDNENNVVHENTGSPVAIRRNSAEVTVAATDGRKSQSIKNKAPVKPPRTKKRSQSNSEITNNDRKTTQRRTQSNSEIETPNKEMFTISEIKKLKTQVSIDKEMNYALTEPATGVPMDDEDLDDLFDVFDQEFDDCMSEHHNSLPVSRKSSIVSHHSSVVSMTPSNTSIVENSTEPEASDEEYNEHPLKVTTNEMDKKTKQEKIENNFPSPIHEKASTLEKISNQELIQQSPVKKKSAEDAIRQQNNNEAETKLYHEHEIIEDYISINKKLLNPRENEDIISSKSTSTINENIASNQKKNYATIPKRIYDPREEGIIQNFQKYYKSKQEETKAIDELKIAKAVDDSPLYSALPGTHKPSDITTPPPEKPKSSDSTTPPPEKPKPSDSTKGLHKVLLEKPIPSDDTTVLTEKPSDDTTVLPEIPKPSEDTPVLAARQKPTKKPTPPGKKPQFTRPRNQKQINPKPIKELITPDSQLSSLDIFSLGNEPSCVNEKDQMARKSTEDNMQNQESIYANFQRPRAQSSTATLSSTQIGMKRLQSVPPTTKIPTRGTPPRSRNRNTSPQIYYDMGAKASKSTYIQPSQINISGRERLDSLRCSSPRKKDEIKEKGEDLQEDL